MYAGYTRCADHKRVEPKPSISLVLIQQILIGEAVSLRYWLIIVVRQDGGIWGREG